MKISQIKTSTAPNLNMAMIAKIYRILSLRRRSNTANTKTRSEVSGSGAKIYRQKGTGRARAGQSRSPVRRGGGISFGPRYAERNIKYNKKEHALSIKQCLQYYSSNDRFFSVTEILNKTGENAKVINELRLNNKISGKILFIGGEKNKYINNIKHVKTINYSNINLYDIINHSVILVSEEKASELNKLIQ